MSRAPVLLFDLGGVLVRNSHLEELAALVGPERAKDDLHGLWLSSPAVQAFERGQIEPMVFAQAFVAEWDLPMAAGPFLEQVASWPKGFYPGVADLLPRLRRTHEIAFLSNSNALHWAGFPDILAHADRVFASHLCGLVKPDPAIFDLVITELERQPGEIIFFDDASANVAAAQEAGMQAHLTKGFGEVVAKIQALGLA